MKTINLVLVLIISVLFSSCGINLKNYKIEDDPDSKQAVEKDLIVMFKNELITKMISETFTFSQEYFILPINCVTARVDGTYYKHAIDYNSEQLDNFINQWYENGYAPGYLDDMLGINAAADGLSEEDKLIIKKNEIISDKFKTVDSSIDTNTTFLWERQPYVENSNVLSYKVTAYLSDIYSKDFLIKFQLNENKKLDYFVE